jgi:hypothetical protein
MSDSNKNNIYRVSFTLEEIKPIVFKNIYKAHDIKSRFCLSRCTQYDVFHDPIINFYNLNKSKKPSMADKLAYILLLSYPKEMIESLNDMSQLKLFSHENTDFNYIKLLEINDDDDNEDHDCACSYEKLKNINIVENKYSGITLQIGSECIKKYKIISNEELNKFKEAEKLRLEQQREIKEGKPIGYYKEEKKRAKSEREQAKLKSEKAKLEKKRKQGFNICYICEKNIVGIKNSNLCVCNSCKKLDICLHNNLNYEIQHNELHSCANCDKSFVYSKTDEPILCKPCSNNKKISKCKITGCDELFCVDKNSNELYCDACEKTKFNNCTDCNKICISQYMKNNRCDVCDYIYTNKIVKVECISCKKELKKKYKYNYKYCNDCYKKIKEISENPPQCYCGTNMETKTITKDCPDKGRKCLGCVNYPNGCKRFYLL